MMTSGQHQVLGKDVERYEYEYGVVGHALATLTRNLLSERTISRTRPLSTSTSNDRGGESSFCRCKYV